MIRPLNSKEVRRLELGKRIWERWKINYGISTVLILGDK